MDDEKSVELRSGDALYEFAPVTCLQAIVLIENHLSQASAALVEPDNLGYYLECLLAAARFADMLHEIEFRDEVKTLHMQVASSLSKSRLNMASIRVQTRTLYDKYLNTMLRENNTQYLPSGKRSA